jgi:hypothetical protein
MLALDDPRWAELKGGYRVLYDPRPALRLLEADTLADGAWIELWEELHHQGDVGEASYAALPHLVRICRARQVADWNIYGLASTIEGCRQAGHNPPLPQWLQNSYAEAWRELVRLGSREFPEAVEPMLILCILAALAAGKGQLTITHVAMMDEEDVKEALEVWAKAQLPYHLP